MSELRRRPSDVPPGGDDPNEPGRPSDVPQDGDVPNEPRDLLQPGGWIYRAREASARRLGLEDADLSVLADRFDWDLPAYTVWRRGRGDELPEALQTFALDEAEQRSRHPDNQRQDLVGEAEKLDPPLRNWEQARIDPRKFAGYSMDPGNKKNEGKWQAWEQLGFDVRSEEGRNAAADDVINQIRAQLPVLPALNHRESEWGLREDVSVIIQGPNGRQGLLDTKWQFDDGGEVAKLITNWLKVI